MRIWSSLARLLLLSIVSVSFYGTHGQQVTRVTYQSGTTISACDGWETEYTCPLSGSIDSNDVQWYRSNRGTNTRVSIDWNGDNAYFLTEDGNTVLTIEDTMRAYDGNLWVEVNSQRFCYTSITVSTRPSSLNVTITKNIKSSSIVLQWDAVDDSLITNYAITWSRAGGGLQIATPTEQTSYTITGLTLDIVYTITVSAANMCGQGPEFRTSILLSTVISEPNNVTVCEGGEAVFTCLLSSSIRSNDVQWYRSLVDMSSSELVEGENISFLNHTTGGALNASLIITNASLSFAGDLWVRIPSRMVCRASLTILPKPSASLRVNVTNNNESLSSVLQWNPVDASPANNYTVTWTSGTDLTRSVATTMETSYTITGLTLDTVYTITVAATNMCGSGPEFSTSVSFSTVINEPDDVTVCEGREAVFTCVLNSNIRIDDVQWYRFIKDTSTTEMIDPSSENVNFIADTTGSTTSSSLTITNVMKSYTGYFWVGTPSLNVCNTSLTVLTSPSALSVNVIKNNELLSVDVQWDAVNDSLITNYTIQWTSDGIDIHIVTLTEQTSHTITGLTLDTVYAITVFAANMCGTGPGFSTSVSFPAVTSEPDDVTTCEGREAVFTCVLNSNIRSDDVQWYRFIKNTSTTEMVDPVGTNINFITDTIGNATNSSLTITNVIKSYTGYFWAGTPSLNVCNASLTVLTSPSNLTVNVTEDIDSLSVFIQWDAVINFLNTTYMVTWNNGINPVESAPLTEQTSYTITGLTLDAVYNITVTAANECGTGSEFSTSIVLSADIPPTSSSISSTITSPVTTTDLIATTIAVVNTSSTIVTINSSIPSDTVVVPSVFLSPVANSTTSFTSTSTTSSIAIITTTTFAVTTTITTTADASTTATVDPTKYTPSLTSIDITTTTAATATTATTVDPTTSTPSLTSIYIKTISTTITGAIPSIIATTSQGGVVSLGGITSLPGEIFQTAVATTSIGVSPAPTTENSSSSEVVSDDGGIGIEIIAGAAAAGGIALLLLIIIVICCGIYIKKKGKRKHRIHRHNTFLSDTSEIPGTLSAYGEEKDKPGIGTFHPPEEDAASIKSDVMNEENQNSEPLSPPNEEPESLHPPDTYDRLPKPPNGQSEVQPFNGYSEADTYDRLRQPVSGYTKLILNQSSDSPDIYDKLVPQKVADPPKSTSDGMQYMNLPNKSNDNRMSGDGGHTENNPSVNNTSCDPPKSASNGDVQYLNVTNVMALNNKGDDDNRASGNQQEITYANLQPLLPSTDRYLPKNNADLLDYISTDL